MSNQPYLTLVDSSCSSSDLDAEFDPLPFYSFDERSSTTPLTQEECATAIHLAHGELVQAARLLKTPLHRLTRLLKQSPRLQRVYEESYGHTLIKAAAVPIATLWDEGADHRRLEWASTAVLKSKLARGHLLSPASDISGGVSLSDGPRTVTFRWRTDADDAINSTHEQTSDDAG
jgi:hypothetical protein